MTLFLFFLLIGILLMIFMRTSNSNQRRNSNRIQTDWPDQNSPPYMVHTNPGLLNNTHDVPTGYTDNVNYSGASPSIYSIDPTVADINTNSNTSSVDYTDTWYSGNGVDTAGTWDFSSGVDAGSTCDFSGFSGGGDFSGGGSGGDWGSASNEQ